MSGSRFPESAACDLRPQGKDESLLWVLCENILARRNVVPFISRNRLDVEPGRSDLIVLEISGIAGNASVGRKTHAERNGDYVVQFFSGWS